MMQVGKSRVAVIGCGYWGKNLVRVFSELGALAAVCDTNEVRAGELAARHGSEVRALADVLADPGVDAVVIATPAATHADLAIQALRAGKHVFVEKPLALSLREAAQVREEAEQGDRILMVGHLLRYHSAFLELERLVKDGALGALQYVYSTRLNFGKIRREENVFWSFAPHDISMILALVGEEPNRVDSVGHCYLHSEIADVTTTHLAFASGINGHIFVSWLHPFKEQKLVVVGSEGMAVFNDGEPWERKLVLFRHKVVWRNHMPEPLKSEGEAIPVAAVEPLREEAGHFLACVQEGMRPRTDIEEATRVLRVLERAQASLRAGHLESV